MERYELYADEAWTHGGEPRGRYHCFYGGIFGRSAAVDRLDTELRAIMSKHGSTGEVKWSNLTERTYELYRELVECLCRHLNSGQVKFRQMHCDRSICRVPELGEPSQTDLDVQFKLCYQFIKHAFGFRYLPINKGGNTEILIRLDTHSSQHHKDRLIDFVDRLPNTLNRPDLDVRTTFVDSRRVPRIQICDLIIGAAGSHGNKMHLRRQPGQKKISAKQKLRQTFAKFVYDSLREVDHKQRKSNAFNWFENTGKDGDMSNLLHHNFRNWKFMSKRYQIDKGWQNDHLDKQGMYVKQNLDPTIYENSPDE